MEERPLVSVVIPTYNSLKTLTAAIDSVINQTYKNIEIIIVDDCSTDSTEAVLEHRYCLRGSGINYIKLPFNSGSPVVPRNTGTGQARGKYLCYLDADDIMYEDKIQTQVEHMEHSFGEHAIMCYHDVDVKEGELIRRWSDMSKCSGGNSEWMFKQLARKNFIPCSSVMINLDKYPNPYMHPEYKVSHDWCLWLDISLVGEIHYIHKRLGTLNLHEGSVITDTHQRRSESRQVIRDRKYLIEKSEYRKIMAYYYLAEIYDMLPKMLQRLIRKYIQWK